MIIDVGGTLRARTPEETLACLKPYAKQAGISRIADLTGLDDVGLPVHTCIRPRSKNLSTSQGKGLTPELSMCSAYMEAIEHYYAEQTPSDLVGSYHALSHEYACISPDVFQQGTFKHDDLLNLPIAWTALRHCLSGEVYYIPRAAISFDLTECTLENTLFKRTTTGLASGNNLEEASCHALLEIIERMNAYRYHRLSDAEKAHRAIKLNTIDCPPLRDRIKALQEKGLSLVIVDVSSTANTMPSYMATLFDERFFRRVGVFSGYGAHVNKDIALSRALTEAVQSRLTLISGSRDDVVDTLYEQKNQSINFKATIDYTTQSSMLFQSFKAMQTHLLASISHDIYRLVYTKPDDAIAVVQLIAPGVSV
ncbi:MAG: hypothetical protein COV52_05415 [Gammaproteobacteria bacterium CG11_big_fil_rev_8_21_14_0_20_46_22]|nr:MAG: hypothetical protein COW05_08245 [Gammaproteobacteria bacterium CG12_big_fil_rev_8_21_14_0_65_46_12]PIR10943.1 MAG: hypothetical protein COV52_05415 [Gammaproteobacteria bacterium CG11_big_fil_rev_8_21_14_0_20_46_22]